MRTIWDSSGNLEWAWGHHKLHTQFMSSFKSVSVSSFPTRPNLFFWPSQWLSGVPRILPWKANAWGHSGQPMLSILSLPVLYSLWACDRRENGENMFSPQIGICLECPARPMIWRQRLFGVSDHRTHNRFTFDRKTEVLMVLNRNEGILNFEPCCQRHAALTANKAMHRKSSLLKVGPWHSFEVEIYWTLGFGVDLRIIC